MVIKKVFLSILSGFLFSTVLGNILIPFFNKIKVKQNVSHFLNERHLQKEGTPTMGGLIFVFSTLIIMILLFLFHKISFSYNIFIVIMVFIFYGFLGFMDDFLKIKYKNNKGLSILTKFFIEVIIAIIFFYLFMIFGNNTELSFLFFRIDLNYLYGFFILFLIIGTSNAVNITDGLDGLASGLLVIIFFTYGIISLNSSNIVNYEEVAIFSFALSGSLLGFLIFNFYPAKIFMGDLGSLALGGALASVAIILKKELTLAIIGFPFIIETLSSLIQIIAIRYFHKKVLLKSPFHHHLEMKNYKETEIIKFFYAIEVLLCLLTLIIYLNI